MCIYTAGVSPSTDVRDTCPPFCVPMRHSVWSHYVTSTGHVTMATAHVIHHGLETLVIDSTVHSPTAATTETALKVQEIVFVVALFESWLDIDLMPVLLSADMCSCESGWMGPECNTSKYL